jgi:hypothetical protein
MRIMQMSVTARLGLPLLAAGQAQKEFLHNEALQSLEMLVAPMVEEPPLSTPPPSPGPGSCYIVATSPGGAWAGKANCLAEFTSGGWRFAEPPEGVSVYVRSTQTRTTFREGAWELSGGPVESPTGGATIDSEARAAIDQILGVLRQHGLLAS